MHPDHERFFGVDCSTNQHQVQVLFDHVAVGMQLKRTKFRNDFMGGDVAHGFFSLHAVVNQVRDGSDFQFVLVRKLLQLRPARHGAIFIQNFNQHSCWLQPGQHGQIDAGLGVAGTRQYTTRLGHKGENMSGLGQVFHAGIGPDRSANRMGTVVSRNTRCNSFRGLDGNGEIGGKPALVFIHHQGQTKLVTALPGQGQTNQSAAEARHEVDVFRAHLGSGHDQVAFIFTVFIIHHHDHAAVPDVIQQFPHGIQSHFITPGPPRLKRAFGCLQLRDRSGAPNNGQSGRLQY